MRLSKSCSLSLWSSILKTRLQKKLFYQNIDKTFYNAARAPFILSYMFFYIENFVAIIW